MGALKHSDAAPLHADVEELLRSLRHPPTQGSREWSAAVEALGAPGELTLDVVLAIADAVIDRAAMPVNHPSPVHIAHRAGVDVIAVPWSLPGGALCSDRVLFVSTRTLRSRRCFAIWHEFAEALLKASGFWFSHPDVQRLSFALIVASDVVEQYVRTHGRARAAAALTRKHRFAQSWMLQIRLLMRDAAKTQGF